MHDAFIIPSAMNEREKVNKDIIEITMNIHDVFPELSKFISEMPVKSFETGSDISLKNLKNYYDSLAYLLKNYSATHTISTKK